MQEAAHEAKLFSRVSLLAQEVVIAEVQTLLHEATSLGADTGLSTEPV
tara:strand:- start:10 stop:153 length:144 start_codon:yes stop_codon:yes gene_type:complete